MFISIIIIEDNTDHLGLIKKVLLESQPEGYIIRYDISHFSEVGLAKKQIAKASPDIVLLDLNVIDSHGKDTFLILKGIPSPIIVTTVLEDAQMGIECMREGAFAYLVKDWILQNPLLLHISIIYGSELYQRQQKIKALVKERLGEYRPLIPRCSYCSQRIGEDRYKDESDNSWYSISEYMHKNNINFTDGICPECMQTYFKDQTK